MVIPAQKILANPKGGQTASEGAKKAPKTGHAADCRYFEDPDQSSSECAIRSNVLSSAGGPRGQSSACKQPLDKRPVPFKRSARQENQEIAPPVNHPRLAFRLANANPPATTCLLGIRKVLAAIPTPRHNSRPLLPLRLAPTPTKQGSASPRPTHSVADSLSTPVGSASAYAAFTHVY